MNVIDEYDQWLDVHKPHLSDEWREIYLKEANVLNQLL